MRLDTRITLLYGNRTEKDIVFRRELEEMQEQNENLKVIFTLNEASDNWTGYTGRITTEMIAEEMPDYRERECYICGPPAMLKAMKEMLEDLNVPKENVKTEYFSGY